jgi:hypothetical protein
MAMSDKIIANLFSQPPILQQYKSSLVTTNPFIPNDQKTNELEAIQSEANNIIESAYAKNKTSNIQDQSLSQLNKNIAQSIIAFIDDIFNKPDEIYWRHYLPIIIQKDQRYTYFGFLLIFISVFFFIVNTNQL